MTLRGATSAAAWGLRVHWGTAAMLIACAGMALAAVLPVAALVREAHQGFAGWLEPRLLLPPIGPLVPEPGWAMARTPAWLQAEAVRRLFQTLVATGLATFALGALGVLLVSAARTAERTGELTIRRAVGASRATVLATALLEGGGIAAGAVLLGAIGGFWSAAHGRRSWPGGMAAPAWAPSAGAAAAVALVVLVSAALALAFLPRRRLADASSRPLGLVIPTLQLGFALVILTAGALLVRHSATPAAELSPSAPGHVLEAAVPEASPAFRSARYATLLGALQGMQDFDSVSLTAPGSVVGLGTVSVATTDCGVCPFGGLFVPWHSVPATHRIVSADSFQALGVHLVAGRGITSADGWDAPRVAVVNRALALRHFQNGEAIGRRLLLGDDPRSWHTVVGIVDDPPPTGLGAALLPAFTVYASVLQHPPRRVELLLRPRRGHAVPPSVDSIVVRLVGSGQVVRAAEAQLLRSQRAPEAWFADAFADQGWAMLVIALLSSLVQMRLWVRSLCPELGLKRALGARRRRILGSILLRAAAVGLAGTAVGLWFGPAVWSAVGSLIAGLPAWEGAIVLRFAALLVGISTLGAALPAWRAARAAPAELLAQAHT